MKIIINALSGIGDAIMFSPSLPAIKKHLPDSQIDMLVMFRQVEDIYKNHPYINKIYFVDFLKQSAIKSFKEVLHLRKNRYDISLNVYPSNRREYNLISFIVGAKKKIATRYIHKSKFNLDFLNSTLVQEVKNRHNVLENFKLAAEINSAITNELPGDLYIHTDIKDIEFADNFLIKNNLTEKFIIGFHAGSATFKGHIMKRWDWKRYRELATKLYEKHNAAILLFGTEQDVNDKIKQDLDYILIPETTNINESLALMNQCKLFVSNDTALMHLAAALKIPTVAIFAYTNYLELYPWNNRHVIIRKELSCSPCFYNSPRPVVCIRTENEKFLCIRDISVAEVFKAVITLIE